jgi:hypothetical protein
VTIAPAPPAPEAQNPDPATAQAERLAVWAREMGEMGMDMARAVHRRTMAEAERADDPDAPPPMRGDPGLTFARLCRAVRMAMTLEMRVAHDETARFAAAAEAAAEIEEARRQRVIDLARAEKTRIQDREETVIDVAQEIMRDEGWSKTDISAQSEDLRDQLLDNEGYAGAFDRSIGETIALICADLGITPDWSQWAREDWAREEARDGAAGSPYGDPAFAAAADDDEDDEEEDEDVADDPPSRAVASATGPPA